MADFRQPWAPAAIPTDAKSSTLGQIKCACSNCGYTVHTTRKWLELAGAPLCPKHGQMDTEKKMQSPTTSITPSALVRVWHES